MYLGVHGSNQFFPLATKRSQKSSYIESDPAVHEQHVNFSVQFTGQLLADRYHFFN